MLFTRRRKPGARHERRALGGRVQRLVRRLLLLLLPEFSCQDVKKEFFCCSLLKNWAFGDIHNKYILICSKRHLLNT